MIASRLPSFVLALVVFLCPSYSLAVECLLVILGYFFVAREKGNATKNWTNLAPIINANESISSALPSLLTSSILHTACSNYIIKAFEYVSGLRLTARL